MNGPWHVEVTPDCIASGVCVGTAPAHFALVEGRSVPRNPSAAPDPLLLSVADACPMEAIRVRAADGTALAPTD
ncbi:MULTISPECIES: ferredoxin [Actinomadura]|uniref:Ferredoxin n=2 Tax=Actinomadura yumaensis TaxID=111807 RepID=A0ABW2CYT1_9ACTN|nr:ferredoxin [Actinomadura sp. J1-007]MWK39156.1 ferredoxin [Actinomadura sp. J1-007]